MITSLRFLGSSGPALPLAEHQRAFTIGTSEECDLVVPSDPTRGVAPVHAIIERTDDAIRVIAPRPAFGSFFPRGVFRSPHAPPVSELLLHAGALGWIGRLGLLAMDRRLETLRPTLAWCLGFDADAAVDDALVAVSTYRPLLLVAPRGADVLLLARAIHDATPDATDFVERDRPTRGDEDATLFVNLDALRTITAPQAVELFASPWERRVRRVILRSTTARRARYLLDSYSERVRTMALPPLASRPADVPRLLEMIWRDELRSTARIEQLGARALRGLAHYAWPGDFAELRAQAARLLAYHEGGGLRPGARALGIKHQTLSGHLARIGVPVLEPADRELMSFQRSSRRASGSPIRVA